jgi:hypothetical protein
LPRRPWRDLLASYETVIEPPVHSGSIDTQDLCGLSNGRQFAGELFSRRLKPGNVSIAAQASDLMVVSKFLCKRRFWFWHWKYPQPSRLCECGKRSLLSTFA